MKGNKDFYMQNEFYGLSKLVENLVEPRSKMLNIDE
jgi:hypothetical protein